MRKYSFKSVSDWCGTYYIWVNAYDLKQARKEVRKMWNMKLIFTGDVAKIPPYLRRGLEINHMIVDEYAHIKELFDGERYSPTAGQILMNKGAGKFEVDYETYRRIE